MKTGGSQSNSSKKTSRDVSAGQVNNSSRPVVAMGAFLLAAIIIVFQLFNLQIIKAAEYSEQAMLGRMRATINDPIRGTIYDRNGKALAVSIESWHICANPDKVADKQRASSMLYDVFGGKTQDYRDMLESGATFVYLAKYQSTEKAEQFLNLGFEGIFTEKTYKREYPYGQTGAQVVGLLDSDGNGLSGLELYYDNILKGSGGGVKNIETGEAGIPIPGGAVEEELIVDGEDIIISIDIEMQKSLELALVEGGKAENAETGSASLLDSENGDILAAASLPLLNPNDRKNMVAGSDMLRSITLQGEPGSVMKSVSAISALQSGKVAPDTKFIVPEEIKADDYVVKDHYEHGELEMTLSEIIANSSNIGTVLAVESIGDNFKSLNENLNKFGFTEKTGVDYPGEASGYLPPYDDWGKISGYNISFGQGISTSNLQVLSFYAALLNDGFKARPRFLIDRPYSDEEIEVDGEVILEDEKINHQMIEILKQVVSNGTSANAQIADYTVAGKSSTAEIAGDSGYLENVYNCQFIGFLPDSEPKLVCQVALDKVSSSASIDTITARILDEAIARFKIQQQDTDLVATKQSIEQEPRKTQD